MSRLQNTNVIKNKNFMLAFGGIIFMLVGSVALHFIDLRFLENLELGALVVTIVLLIYFIVKYRKVQAENIKARVCWMIILALSVSYMSTRLTRGVSEPPFATVTQIQGVIMRCPEFHLLAKSPNLTLWHLKLIEVMSCPIAFLNDYSDEQNQ